MAPPQEHRQPPDTGHRPVTGVVSDRGLGLIGDGESRSPLTAIPHPGPLDVYSVFPARISLGELADLVAGPAEAISITPRAKYGEGKH